MLPQRILDQFARIPDDTPIKNKYYGVYDRILNTVCFIDDAFIITPQYALPQAVGVSSVDPVVTYVVEVNELPVFFLEIKPPLHFDVCGRANADAQMRSIFRDLYNMVPTARLHGISVMGRRLAFYCLDKATGRVNPSYVAPLPDKITDTVPAERWEADITTEEGYQKFMAVINDVKQMAAAL